MRRHLVRRLLALAFAGTALVGVVPAASPSIAAASPARQAAPMGAPLPDPGVPGPLAVDELSYDFGDEAFKPTGFPARVELKAKVYAPQTIDDRAPLVIVQHGRHVTCASATDQLLAWPCPAEVPEVPSYQGYDALGRNLASYGMVVVSIGANGINANDGFLDDGGAAARAQLILEHLRRWKAWNASAAGSPFGDRFVGRIDLESVGLMGHSRGGEGVVAAVQLNQRSSVPFGIRAVMALAPVDFGRRVVGGVELGVILPACDGDVSDLQGAAYYDDGRYATPGDESSKMTALLAGANHNFFNTVWTSGPGSSDDAAYLDGEALGSGSGSGSGSAPDPCQPGGPGRLTADQQSQAGTALMAGFLRRTLQPEPALARFVTGTAPYPASTGPARWSIAFHGADRLDIESWSSPDTYRRNQSGQLSAVTGLLSGLVCNPKDETGFERPDGVQVVSTRCPNRDWSAMVNDTGVLDAGWVRQGSFVRIPLAPEGVDVSSYDGIRMRVAVPVDSRNTTRAKQDFSIVLEDVDGARATVPASTGTNGLQRLNPGNVQHGVLNGLRLPLSTFSTVDLTRVKAVELRFDRTGAGRLAIADLAFTQEGTGSASSLTVGASAITPSQPACRRSNANRWACAVGQLAWGRDVLAEEIPPLAAGYQTAVGRQKAIARAIGGPTAAELHRSQYLQTFIQGEIDAGWALGVLSPAGRKYWEAAVIDLTVGFALSTASTSTPADTVRSAYESILGRPADPVGLAYWTPRVQANGARGLATSLVKTTTYRGRVVDERYQQILGRVPDAGGRSYWVAKLASPGGEQALVASLLATENFRIAATH